MVYYARRQNCLKWKNPQIYNTPCVLARTPCVGVSKKGGRTNERQGCFDPRLPLEGMVRFLSLAELNQDWRSLCEELSLEELEQVCYWNL